jgi:hypothetical protein
VRRFLKLLHTIATAGIMGGGVAVAVLALLAPAAMASGSYPAMANGMAKIAAWVIAPSMLLVIVTGLLAMVVVPAFQNAGWVWAKAATGILVFQAGVHVLGPLQGEAQRSAQRLDPAGMAEAAAMLTATANTLWVLLAIAVINIVLAIWRPRFFKPPA